VTRVFEENPKLRLGYHQLTSRAIPRLRRKARKMATPPSRGSGVLCRCRSKAGTATHPRALAALRTYLVRISESSTEAAKIAR